MFYRVDIATHTVVGAALPELPDVIRGLSDEDLLDLSFADHQDLVGIGYWKGEPTAVPQFDPLTQKLTVVPTVDIARRVVVETVAAVALSAEEVAAGKELARSSPLSQLQFMNLFPDAKLTAILRARDTNDAVLLVFEKFRSAGTIYRNNQQTIDGVNALVGLGFLASGERDAILAL